MKHNPERRSWRGRSYRRGGAHVRTLRDRLAARADRYEAKGQASC